MDPNATPLGQSPAFLDALAQVSRLAGLNRPVLVIGERGSGKELAAARLHYLSPRWSRPLVRINCAALPESLLESELFGHEAGAFTGATRRRLGRFEQADGGTLFLDEIAAASGAAQERLLRAVEYGEIDRLGGGTVRVDTRVVAATNADLPALARAGKFRADLLDRLAFDVVTLPPLRARPEDVMLLANHFAMEMVKEMRGPLFAGFTAAAERTLRGHDWPGNVRELRSAVQRATASTPPGQPVDRIVLDPFDSPWRPADAAPEIIAKPKQSLEANETVGDFSETVAACEKRLLTAALAAARHNQRRAAQALGLTYHQLRGHLRRHGLTGGGEADTAGEKL